MNSLNMTAIHLALSGCRFRNGTFWLALRLAFALTVVTALPFPGVCSAAVIHFYGDLLLSRGVEKFVHDQGTPPVHAALAPFLAQEGAHVVNLEGAVGSACVPGKNPCFAIKSGILDLLEGFDVVSLQNNHSLDAGEEGLRRTAGKVRDRGSAALSGKAFSTVMDTKAGRVAVVAATDVVNALSDREILVRADEPELLREIRRLKATSTAVAVYVHWGRELVSTPTDRMKELARKYVAAGADLVVGTHPHVTGGAACVEGKPVVWSLGNFLFDQKYDSTKRGAVLDCDIVDGKLVCGLVPHKTQRGSYLPAYTSSRAHASDNALLASCTPAVTATWMGSFGHKGHQQRLQLVPEGARGLARLELYEQKTGRRAAKTSPMPIRRVQTVDLNGDGIQEIMLILDVYSSLDREVAKRVYLYSFQGGFHALWRGSALSRPLLDATFVKQGKKAPSLVALHTDDTFLKRRRGTKGRTVMRYQWNGFGFTGAKELKEVKGSQSCDGLTCFQNQIRLLRQGKVATSVLMQ